MKRQEGRFEVHEFWMTRGDEQGSKEVKQGRPRLSCQIVEGFLDQTLECELLSSKQ